jgi:4-hydroxy-2-oxoheptanedioate aldolase
MEKLRNPAREKLEIGQLALGAGIRLARTAEIANIMKTAGFDWLFIDLEHGSMSIDTASQISVAALNSGIAPIARVPNGEYSMATRLLDNGAVGIVVPHVDTAEEAAEIVRRLKYPPVGHRSVVGTMPHFDYRQVSMKDTASAINEASLTIVMIETPTAVANAAEIAKVPGIDILLVGSNDLCSEMGITSEFSHPRFVEALKTVATACIDAGKWPGLAGVYSEDLIGEYLKFGFHFILCGADLAFMMSAARSRAAAVHNA